MRISELARRTGVRKETIHFYLREGLLPKPRKAGRNMAFYDEAHVDQLLLIRRLQHEKYLPLDVIRRVLHDGRPRGGSEDLELLAGLFHLTGGGGEPALTRAELRRRSRLSDEEIDRARAAGLIGPRGDGDPATWELDDLRTLELLREAAVAVGAPRPSPTLEPRAFELAVEGYALCIRHLRAMARDEAGLYFERLLHAPEPIALLDGMRRARSPQARFIAHARARLLQHEIADYVAQIERAVDDTGGPSAFPLSATALATSGFMAARAALARAEEEGSAEASEQGCLADFTVGRLDALQRAVEVARARHGNRPRLLAWAGAAAVERGELEAGIGLLEAATRPSTVGPPAVIAFALLGAAWFRLARRTIEQAEPGSALKQIATGLEAFAHLDSAPLLPAERLRALLARGRALTSLPRFFGTRAAGITDLRAVLATAAAGGAGSLPGMEIALTMNAAWFLALAVDDPVESAALRARAMAIDPEGPIAARRPAR